jgi:uncharacterized protein YqcC (DUF446 family)
MSFAPIVRKLDEIEAEMKRIGYWQAEPPAELLAKVAAGEIGYLDPGFSFEQYLQLVFLLAARQRLKDKDLPRESNVGAMAMRQYHYHSHVPEAEGLLTLLSEFDELVETLPKRKGAQGSS